MWPVRTQSSISWCVGHVSLLFELGVNYNAIHEGRSWVTNWVVCHSSHPCPDYNETLQLYFCLPAFSHFLLLILSSLKDWLQVVIFQCSLFSFLSACFWVIQPFQCSVVSVHQWNFVLQPLGAWSSLAVGFAGRSCTASLFHLSPSREDSA